MVSATYLSILREFGAVSCSRVAICQSQFEHSSAPIRLAISDVLIPKQFRLSNLWAAGPQSAGIVSSPAYGVKLDFGFAMSPQQSPS